MVVGVRSVAAALLLQVLECHRVVRLVKELTQHCSLRETLQTHAALDEPRVYLVREVRGQRSVMDSPYTVFVYQEPTGMT